MYLLSNLVVELKVSQDTWCQVISQTLKKMLFRSVKPVCRLSRHGCLILTSRHCACCSFSSTTSKSDYADTIQNLKIGRHTRVIFQGFTGRQATANAKESIEWGTQIVGGVTPSKEGEHLGLPVLPSVRKAKEVLNPHATGIYVAAHQAPAAIEEAIEAEISLIVAVAEHIPLHDILRVNHSMANTSWIADGHRYTRFSKLNPNLGSWVQTLQELFQPLASVE